MATSKSRGIGFLGMLTILFIGLKLSNIITWSWFWVLSPIWGPVGIGLSIGLFFLILGFFFAFKK